MGRYITGLVLLLGVVVAGIWGVLSRKPEHIPSPTPVQLQPSYHHNPRLIEEPPPDPNKTNPLFDNPKFKALAEGKYVVKGVIDKHFIMRLANAPKDNHNILFVSEGGITKRAIVVSRIIRDHNFNIYIAGYCLSACAEYILPVSDPLTFLNQPLVGFHQNPISNKHFVTQLTGYVRKDCTYKQAYKLARLQSKHGANPEFWKQVYEHLIVEDIIPEYLETCVKVQVKTKYPMWFPTSRQLREDFGLKFTGDVCADDKACYSQKLKILYPKGTTLAVGNTTYTVP